MKKTALSLTLVLALFLPSAARAQGGSATVPAAPGEQVIVTQSTSGMELRGRIVELSATSLALLVDGKRVDIPVDSVLRIDVRTDSVKNGTFIGGGVFLGLAALACATSLGDEPAQCATVLASNTLFGALAGAGIDALHKGRTTIYSKSPAGLALALAPTRKGGRLQFKVTF